MSARPPSGSSQYADGLPASTHCDPAAR
jgi:hypothetical protein